MKLSCSGWHTLCILSNGSLYVWGSNEFGRMGIGGNTSLISSVLVPQQVNVENEKWKDTAVRMFHSIALSQSGIAYGCGNNQYGQLFDLAPVKWNSQVPLFQPLSLNRLLGEEDNRLSVVQVGACDYTSFLLLNDGRVVSFGNNRQGQRGFAATTDFVPPSLMPSVWKLQPWIPFNSSIHSSFPLSFRHMIEYALLSWRRGHHIVWKPDYGHFPLPLIYKVFSKCSLPLWQ